MKKKIWIAIAVFALFAIGYEASNDSNSFSTGDRVVVIKDTWGCVDENTVTELIHAANASDNIGILELQMKGQIEFIKKGSYGKSIRSSISCEQIRFDDGSLYWVPSTTVEKAK